MPSSKAGAARIVEMPSRASTVRRGRVILLTSVQKSHHFPPSSSSPPPPKRRRTKLSESPAAETTPAEASPLVWVEAFLDCEQRWVGANAPLLPLPLSEQT